MTILDIIKTSTRFLGLANELQVLESATAETESQIYNNAEIKSLFELSKFAIQEFCSSYVPMVVSQQIATTDKKYALSGLTNYLRVVNVEQNGQKVAYKVINRNLVFEEDGLYVVYYSSYPAITSIFSSIDFVESVSPEVLVLGLCAYYSLSKGMFEDFKDYHDEYVARAGEIRELKIFPTPARRWE